MQMGCRPSVYAVIERVRTLPASCGTVIAIDIDGGAHRVPSAMHQAFGGHADTKAKGSGHG
jgi:hypothetical protein